MLFNSSTFAVFLPLSLIVYWALQGRLRAQNSALVVLSYVFYGMWDWRFLSLLLGSTVIDYVVSNSLARTDSKARRRILVWISVGANLGILGTFKYYGFFVHSLRELMDLMGVGGNFATLDIVLPVGISFYTFQTMSYTIDVYRRRLQPTSDFLALAAYVAFFPQLVAGPIERGTLLLPQVTRARSIDGWKIRQALWLLLLGFVRKSVIADNASLLVERVYDAPGVVGGVSLLVATMAFAVQIYGDFAGYSNMARGIALLFGFDLMVNFRSPYSSRSIQEFWRRWHVSLSSWLRDYLYVSLGGNRRGTLRTYVNLMATMLLGGLWHGAAWNFVFWGGWQGAGLVFHRLLFRGGKQDGTRTGWARAIRSVTSWCLTFAFVLQGWLLFRADGMHSVLTLSRQWFDWSTANIFTLAQSVFVAAAFGVILILDWVESRNYEDLVPAKLGWLQQLVIAVVVVLAIAGFGSFRSQPFLYFQF